MDGYRRSLGFLVLIAAWQKGNAGVSLRVSNDPTRECRCSPLQIQRYVGRISGPLLDRIDIHIDVPAVKFRELTGDDSSETDSSNVIRNRVIQARQRQLRRFKGDKIFSNAAMTPRMIRTHCQIDAASERMLESAMTRLGL